MSRGNGGSEIFLSDADRELFLETLSASCTRAGWWMHAYVLMPNHYHFLLETPGANLAVGMKWFQGTYTQRFNARHKRWGHVYQGRYKALIIDPEDPDYFNKVSSYIHLNPVRAGLCCHSGDELKEYRWSSYPYYLKSPKKRPEYLSVGRVFEGFHVRQDDRRGRSCYESYMNERVGWELDPKKQEGLNRSRKAIRRGWCLGGDEFRGWLLKQLDTESGSNESLRGSLRRAHGEQVAEAAIKKWLGSLDLTKKSLNEFRKSAPEKQVMAWWLRTHTVVSANWISDQLQMGHRVNVARAVKIVGTGEDKGVTRLKKKLLKVVA